MKDWTLADHWAGLRPKSPDGLPLLGPVGTKVVFVASGQYRNGILFTPAIAQEMADIMLGKAAPYPRFRSQKIFQENCMSDFAVDPVIQSLTTKLADWPLCRVFLYNDSRYHWGLLVPRRPGVIEMCDLGAGRPASD